MKQFFLFISFLISFWTYAQKDTPTQTIRGIVIDNVTKSSLPGATVTIVGTNPLIGTTTNINGEFKFENVAIGRVSLQVTFIGFESAMAKNLLLSSGKELIVNLVMEETAFEMDEVVITAENNKEEAINEMATASARTFSIEETETCKALDISFLL